METFMDTLCKFMDIKAKTVLKCEGIALKDLNSNTQTKEVCEKLKSSMGRLRRPESVSQKLYRYIVCKSWFCFLLPIWWIAFSASAMLNNHWYYFIDNLIFTTMIIYLTIMNPDENDWLYIWRLKLHLWFRKVPQPTENMENPRCIFVHWKNASQESRTKKILRALQKDLCINELEDLRSTLEVAQSTENNCKIFHLIQDAIFSTRFTRIHLLLFVTSNFIIYFYTSDAATATDIILQLVVIYTLRNTFDFCLPKLSSWLYHLLIIRGLSAFFFNYYITVRYLLPQGFLSNAALFWILFFHFSQYNTDYARETNMQILDVICRLHKSLKNESIFFTVVTNDFKFLTEIPEQYNRYFKFMIKAENNQELSENYDEAFDLSLISKTTPSPAISEPTKTKLRDWVDASLRCINEKTSQFVAEGLRFLSLLIENSDDVLNDAVMVSVVRLQLTAFAANYTNEISFKNQDDVLKVKHFFGYLESLGIIPRASATVEPTNPNLKDWVDASLRCLNENASPDVVYGLKHLLWLIETNNDQLTKTDMLNMVKKQLAAFAANYKNEISFKDQSDVLKVKDFFGYLENLGIIPEAGAAVEPTNPNIRDWVDASLQCINENTSQFVQDGLKHLLWLIENKDDVLTETDMLNLVKMRLTAFAANYTNEISFKDEGDVLKVKDFFCYLSKLKIIPSASTTVEPTNPNLRDWVDASLRCINENASPDVVKGLKHLFWLIENKDDHLTETDMLNLVKMRLTAFAANYTNEISFKDPGDLQKVKDFLGYLAELGVIPRTITEAPESQAITTEEN